MRKSIKIYNEEKIKQIREDTASCGIDDNTLEMTMQYYRLGDLTSRVEFQREINKKRSFEISKNFLKVLWNPPKVVELDGVPVIVDGQHRVAALRIKKVPEDQLIWCIKLNLTYEQAAYFFGHQDDNSARPTTVDKFNASVESADEDDVTIKNILDKYGIKTGNVSNSNTVSAVVDLKSAYANLSTAQFEGMIRIISKTFDSNDKRWCSKNIRAMRIIMDRYVDRLNEKKFIDVMNDSKVDFTKMLSDADSKMIGNDKAKTLAYQMVITYNKRIRSNRLDEKQI